MDKTQNPSGRRNGLQTLKLYLSDCCHRCQLKRRRNAGNTSSRRFGADAKPNPAELAPGPLDRGRRGDVTQRQPCSFFVLN